MFTTSLLISSCLYSSLRRFQRFPIARMGGNAIRNTPVSRIDLTTMNEVKAVIQENLSPYVVVDFPFERPGKTDFGDIDVLYKPNATVSIIDLMHMFFNPAETVHGGGVISFPYHIEKTNQFVQVDLIKVKSMEMAKFYYSYGDCGNILGMLTHHYGLKFGHQGLFIVPTRETIEGFDGSKLREDVTEQLILSDEPEEICRFLGLDYNTWKQFESASLEDIFAWITSSRLFYGKLFVNNHKHRKKIDIRPMYANFIKLCEKSKSPARTKLPKEQRQRQYQLEALTHFQKGDELRQIIEKAKKFERRRVLFNGHKFMPHGFMGPALGEAIVGFKKHVVAKFGVSKPEEWLDGIKVGSEGEVDAEIDQYCRDRVAQLSAAGQWPLSSGSSAGSVESSK